MGGLDPVLQQIGISWATKNRLQHLTNAKRVLQCQELCLAPEKNALFLHLQSRFPSFFSSGLPSSSKMSTHHIPERRVTLVQHSKARPHFHVGPTTAAVPHLPGEGETRSSEIAQHSAEPEELSHRQACEGSKCHTPDPRLFTSMSSAGTRYYTRLDTRAATSGRTPAQLCCSSPPSQTLLRSRLHHGESGPAT